MKAAIRILAILLLALPATVLAQNYPSKPIRFIVGFAPGGGNDIAARLMAPKLSEALGQPVVVENRPGAGTNIAQEVVARSAPDGSTLLLGSPPVIINKYIYKNLQFDPQRDLVGVSMFAASPNVLVVNASSPVKSIKDMIALAQSNPGKLTFSTSGVGSLIHLSGELFNIRANVKTVHVAYRGAAPALTALLSQEVDMSYANIPALLNHLKTGRIRPLATTGAKRSELLRDVPTMKESGVDMDMTVWFGVFVPSATPRTVIDRLAGILTKMPHTPEMKKRLADLGAEPVGSTPEEFAKRLKVEEPMLAEVVKVSGAKPE
jgi:tripartite-type tricarboxylate transporter receptor subunit TctC